MLAKIKSPVLPRKIGQRKNWRLDLNYCLFKQDLFLCILTMECTEKVALDLLWIWGDTRHNVWEPHREWKINPRREREEGKRTQERDASRGREDRTVSGTWDCTLKETLEDANPNPTSKIPQPPPSLWWILYKDRTFKEMLCESYSISEAEVWKHITFCSLALKPPQLKIQAKLLYLIH